MQSIGDKIVAAMVAALNVPADKPATTYRTRTDALNVAELPAMVMFNADETVEVHGAATRRRMRTVRLEIMVEGPEPADAALDPLYVFAVNTILADATVASLVKGLYESRVQWGASSSYQDAAVALVDFVVHYTTTNDPSQAGAQ